MSERKSSGKRAQFEKYQTRPLPHSYAHVEPGDPVNVTDLQLP